MLISYLKTDEGNFPYLIPNSKYQPHKPPYQKYLNALTIPLSPLDLIKILTILFGYHISTGVYGSSGSSKAFFSNEVRTVMLQ
jgi:hypothetical protein